MTASNFANGWWALDKFHNKKMAFDPFGVKRHSAFTINFELVYTCSGYK